MRGGGPCVSHAPLHLCQNASTYLSILKHNMNLFCRIRPYQVQCTGSHPNSEVNVPWALLVLGWGTTREHSGVVSVLFFFSHILIWGGANMPLPALGNYSSIIHMRGSFPRFLPASSHNKYHSNSHSRLMIIHIYHAFCSALVPLYIT